MLVGVAPCVGLFLAEQTGLDAGVDGELEDGVDLGGNALHASVRPAFSMRARIAAASMSVMPEPSPSLNSGLILAICAFRSGAWRA
jgi:hypothetical protein